MLVLRDDAGRILLERRGPQGVWSGLWSLPEATDPATADTEAARFAAIGSATALPVFTHVFSHYRLNVAPILFDRATAPQRIADNPDLRWCDAAQAAALGLPAPVRTLLDTLWEKRA
jgi:A/G-specific adenine glycosylase